jgi:DNA-binding response OmpR family regulator
MTVVSSRVTPWTFVLDEPVRVLVVDDDPILREFASVHLATPCATIDTACDVPDARTHLRNNDYDLVLLDIEMPGFDGFGLLGEIRASERLKHLPVIMLTGHDDIASIDRAYQIGANSFATKPVNWRQLSYQVRYVVRMSGRRKEPARGEAGTPKLAGDALDSLRSAIDRADTLRDHLPPHDRTRLATLLQELGELADRVSTRCARQNSSGGAQHAAILNVPCAAIDDAA